eukprot:3553785-Amphidinium_carterae.1
MYWDMTFTLLLLQWGSLQAWPQYDRSWYGRGRVKQPCPNVLKTIAFVALSGGGQGAKLQGSYTLDVFYDTKSLHRQELLAYQPIISKWWYFH